MKRIPLLPYWVYRVTPAPAARGASGWRGWRLKTWVWDVDAPECDECGSRFRLIRVDTPIGRGSAFTFLGNRR